MTVAVLDEVMIAVVVGVVVTVTRLVTLRGMLTVTLQDCKLQGSYHDNYLTYVLVM